MRTAGPRAEAAESAGAYRLLALLLWCRIAKILPTVPNGQNFLYAAAQAAASPATFSRNNSDTHHSPAIPTTV